MESESIPVVPANRLLEVAGLLSEGAARLHAQLRDLPPARRQAVLEAVVGQMGDMVRAWSQLVQAVVSVEVAASRAEAEHSTNGDEAPFLRYRRPGPVSAPSPSSAPSPLDEPSPLHEASPSGAPSPESIPKRPRREWAEPLVLARDDLTGALNRSSGFAALERELERCRREGAPFVLGYLNVDAMQDLNESMGSQAGDERLRKVAAALRTALRASDVILRLGGDEFLFSLSGADVNTAESRMKEFGLILEQDAVGASVSVGFAELRPDESLDDLVARADDALVQARRRRGRPRLR